MIATVRKGHVIKVNGTAYTVMGSRSLRGRQFYIVRDANGVKQSISRAEVLNGQRDGTVQVTA